MELSPQAKSSLTLAQQQAVAARGNVLVLAGAGTGKTQTLIARCLDCLERDGAAMDALLVVTFTEAAAAEIRQRLRNRLEEKIVARPDDERWLEQTARFDLAHIGTLHSFCLTLIREHFYELGLDPQLAVLDEGETRQIAHETLEEQFQSHYEGGDEFSLAVQDLIRAYGGGRDEDIRKFILRLHNYSQSRPDAAGWLTEQIRKFSAAEPADWQGWLLKAIGDWHDEWLPALDNLKTSNAKAAELAGVLSRLPKSPPRKIAAEVLEQIISADGKDNFPKGKFTVLRKPLADLFDEAAFLQSFAVAKDGSDPLAEDWSWIRGHMETVLRLAEEFAGRFAERKRANGALDFHDLEQFALKLLWDFSAGKPTAIAETWRAKLKFIFVDEYQDINAAQDKIISALSREEWWGECPHEPSAKFEMPGSRGRSRHQGNRFLVGDVKQSIYRFRLANSKIFRDYARQWRGKTGETISLADNFRSHELLLNFVNSVFRLVMREAVGGVEYDAEAELKFGSRRNGTSNEAAREKARQADNAPRAELLLRWKRGRGDASDAEASELTDLDETEKEARLVAGHLKKRVAEPHKIWDDKKKEFRNIEWRDIAILLRSPRGKSEIFAREFERAGVPLAVARGGFYESAEILDLLSLLQLLDNPLQDVPCIAVLRSPLVGLSLDELAEIRLAAREVHFWTALARSERAEGGRRKETAAKISRFLERFSRWRNLARQVSLSACLEEILTETHYADWLRAQSRGEQRAVNIAAFLHLAQKFDQFQRQGLFRFLKSIEAQQEAEAEPEVPAMAAENAVRLMSIHQSKGLEFPVVVLADLAKPFNEQDLRGEIILDEEYGLCPKVRPPAGGRRYPSLPHWLARRRQRRELRGEELRLLYVAMTRARDQLILTASISEKNWSEKWMQPQPVTTQAIAGAKCFADWLGLWFSVHSPQSTVENAATGELPNLRWRIIADAELAENAECGMRNAEKTAPALDSATVEKLRERLDWNYSFRTATERKAKSSVTVLRREAEELDDEAEQMFPPKIFKGRLARTLAPPNRKRRLTAAEIGAAHHKFLQHVALDQIGELGAEAERLVRENYLSADERSALNLDSLKTFWNSSIGKKILVNAASVRRELPFTARFSPAELAQITGAKKESGLEDEFVVVQGVADLMVLLPGEIWLLDFKTDEVLAGDLAEKTKTYAPQLKLYAAALERIYLRPVPNCWLHFLALDRTEKI